MLSRGCRLGSGGLGRGYRSVGVAAVAVGCLAVVLVSILSGKVLWLVSIRREGPWVRTARRLIRPAVRIGRAVLVRVPPVDLLRGELVDERPAPSQVKSTHSKSSRLGSTQVNSSPELVEQEKPARRGRGHGAVVGRNPD